MCRFDCDLAKSKENGLHVIYEVFSKLYFLNLEYECTYFTNFSQSVYMYKKIIHHLSDHFSTSFIGA